MLDKIKYFIMSVAFGADDPARSITFGMDVGTMQP